MKAVIVGAGLLGASVAYALAKRGIESTVIDAGPVAGAASGRSFGWINASFHLDEAHFRLRVAAMEAWRQVDRDLGGLVDWCGALCFEAQGAELEAQAAKLEALGYPVEQADLQIVAERAPGVALPEQCLWFPAEGVIEPDMAARVMLAASGARVISGCAVEAVEHEGGRVTGLRLAAGRIEADTVVIAAGVGVRALLAPFLDLPMVRRPAVLLRTRPVDRFLRTVLVSPWMELRQDALGRIIAPASAGHQSDTTERLEAAPGDMAEEAMERMAQVLPGMELALEEVVLAERPVPGDDQPVMGAVGPDGLYACVMHSGATLGAHAGALVARELEGEEVPDLARYRPGRFV
ncbi:NAD(P)/FAD-dependent oxidoreductase [Rhodalgimonas zhirmunskyi]|uniref:FAD-binding oxidoreductase n=1 Tax=Rhodalgimonas zhirmunskyi TaxID=2964767 RepID=A0AAJ1UC68_9RHOB|nr:FAD-dependent oxidoreductase [Rhodoalgimonas zhirmunskyi]MDQ2095203.1 FAD-binding oxidoreductase [Rhodoalgimonas zhirmunskyi]